MKLSATQKDEINRWNPFMIYTWSKAQLQLWYDTYGSFGTYNGQMWEPASRNLGVGRYEVKFKVYGS